MAYDLTRPLVIGIGSRALFDLEQENRIFEEQGVAAYARYQIEHENEILKKGSAFPLVRAFLELNHKHQERLVEVIVMSRNSPNTSLRIFHSIEAYGLDITRAALTSGAPIAPYLKAFETDLFLSANSEDVEEAINNGIAAGRILTGAVDAGTEAGIDQIRIAFDGDAVLFSAEAEKIFQEAGIEAFEQHEKANADTPMGKGPFANFLLTLSRIQDLFSGSEECPVRTALVTSRNAPAHERAIKTLRQWGVHIDEAFFLGGVKKTAVLAAFGAHIFFDDQDRHTGPASQVVPSATVPYRNGENPMGRAAETVPEHAPEL